MITVSVSYNATVLVTTRIHRVLVNVTTRAAVLFYGAHESTCVSCAQKKVRCVEGAQPIVGTTSQHRVIPSLVGSSNKPDTESA